MAKQTTTTSDTHTVSPEIIAEDVKETEEHSTNTTKPTALKYIGEHRDSPIPLRRGSIFYGLPKILEEALEKDPTLNALFVHVDSE